MCATRWRLTITSRLAGGFTSEVFAAVTARGLEVVLKLVATAAEANAERAALSAWSGSGAAVALLAANDEAAALLLERLHPGTALDAETPEVADRIGAAVLGRLHAVPAGDADDWPTWESGYRVFEARAHADATAEWRWGTDRVRAERRLALLPRLRSEARELLESADRRVLLHGDFADKNVLRSRSGYVAIDPIPMIGDPASDIGFFAAGRPPVSSVLERAETLASALGEDPGRARRWASLWAGHQAIQAWRADQADLDQFVRERFGDRAEG